MKGHIHQQNTIEYKQGTVGGLVLRSAEDHVRSLPPEIIPIKHFQSSHIARLLHHVRSRASLPILLPTHPITPPPITPPSNPPPRPPLPPALTCLHLPKPLQSLYKPRPVIPSSCFPSHTYLIRVRELWKSRDRHGSAALHISAGLVRV